MVESKMMENTACFMKARKKNLSSSRTKHVRVRGAGPRQYGRSGHGTHDTWEVGPEVCRERPQGVNFEKLT